MKLRPYQNEALSLMNEKRRGSYLISLATGLGKTVVFTSYMNQTKKRILLLSHREELVNQPLKYIDRDTGIEMKNLSGFGRDVVSASVQSITRRLDKYPRDYFDVIITDEAHHAPCKSYQNIYDYFDFDLHFGFTATPNRSDNVRLNQTFDEIIYNKDLVYGIKNGYLSDIECKRYYANYDLRQCKISNGDFSVADLDNAVNTKENAEAIGKIYQQSAIGATLIFGVSVDHCEKISKQIPGSVVITGKTKNRSEIIEKFTRGEIKCLVNCMVFTEGTDIPLINTIIIARPTKNASLYTQMVGRGLRLHENKDKLHLVDVCGVSQMDICTAPTLLGLDVPEMDKKPMTIDRKLQGDLFDLEEKLIEIQDKPDYWKINYKIVSVLAKKQGWSTRGINFTKMPNGDLVIKIPGYQDTIKKPDELGKTVYIGVEMSMQKAIDMIYEYLCTKHADSVQLWDIERIKRWGRKPASEKQKAIISSKLGYNTTNMTMIEASQILNRLFTKV